VLRFVIIKSRAHFIDTIRNRNPRLLCLNVISPHVIPDRRRYLVDFLVAVPEHRSFAALHQTAELTGVWSIKNY